MTKRPSKSTRKRSKSELAKEVQAVVASLKRCASKSTRDGMARYGLPSDKAFGVPVGKIRDLGKELGRDHALAEALWKTGHYEARMLCSFVADPALVTPKQMDRWAKDFDNWGICDTICFHLWDRSPHAMKKVAAWANHKDEFVKRAAFALLASVALHDKKADDAPFVRSLALIERGASDERNFVKKGVSWALRGIGKRNPTMKAEALKLAKRLAKSDEPAARWVGKDALKDLSR